MNHPELIAWLTSIPVLRAAALFLALAMLFTLGLFSANAVERRKKDLLAAEAKEEHEREQEFARLKARLEQVR